jgi:peptidoglycan/xylan/chitin deacetylase (PgdA/CDA1 family)
MKRNVIDKKLSLAGSTKLVSVFLIGVFFLTVLSACRNSVKKPVAAESTQAADTNGQNEVASDGTETPNTATQILAKPEVPILCYHRIEAGKKGDYTVSPSTFEAQIKALADSGFHSVTPTQLYEWLLYNKPLPSKPVMITFDDSRSEHFSIAAPVLEKHGFRGVFFIMTITYGKKNYMTTGQIATLRKTGHVIGLHTWDHTMVTQYKDSADWRKEIADPRKKLEGIVGVPVDFFAYPNGVYNHQATEKLHQYFKISFTLISKRDTVYPLQTVRRMLATEGTSAGLIRSMRRTFKLL